MLAAGADVARDLRELVDGHEDAVVAVVLEVEVVARDARDRAGLEAGEARDAVVLVHDDVAGAQVGERAQHAARRPIAGRGRAATAAKQPVLGDHGEPSAGATKPSRERRRGRRSARRLRRRVARARRPRGASGCMRRARRRRAAARSRRCDSPSAGAFERRLGLGERARGARRGLGMKLDRRPVRRAKTAGCAHASAGCLDLAPARRRGDGRRRRGRRR